MRYIKLGPKGSWEQDCLAKGIIRFGFGTADPNRFLLCNGGLWEELKKSLIEQGKVAGKATEIVGQTRRFFEDDGSLVWITFIGGKLYWGRMDEEKAKPHESGDGVYRPIVGGWSCNDLHDAPLRKAELAGHLTQIVGYQGTSCGLTDNTAQYVIRRIDGQTMPHVERAEKAMKNMKSSVIEMMRALDPNDFEILVDIVFTTTGWRRQGVVGKTQKFIDMDLISPSTGERACVQVKSSTTQADLAHYVKQFEEQDGFQRMFFVHHSGMANTENDRVAVLGPEKFAQLVIDAGLTNWLIRKVA